MPGSIKIDDGSGNYTILTNGGSLGSDKTLTIPNETATLATTTATNLGGLVLLATGTASNSSELLFDDFVDLNTYCYYYLTFDKIKPVSDNVEFQFNYRTGGSSGSNLTGTYNQGGIYYYGTTGTGAIFGNAQNTDHDVIDNGIGNANNEAIMGYGHYFPGDGNTTGNINMLNATVYKREQQNLLRKMDRTSFLDANTATTGLRFFCDTGNISSGTVKIYGVKK